MESWSWIIGFNSNCSTKKGVVVLWFRSYITDKKQKVTSIDCVGVPRDSFLVLNLYIFLKWLTSKHIQLLTTLLTTPICRYWWQAACLYLFSIAFNLAHRLMRPNVMLVPNFRVKTTPWSKRFLDFICYKKNILLQGGQITKQFIAIQTSG